MSIIENNIVEAHKFLRESERALAEAELAKINKSIAEKEAFANNYYNIIESARDKQLRRGRLLEATRNDALSTVIKAIYITALEANTLTDDAIALAESLVDKWVREKGANSILSEVAGKTYLLDRLTQIVEDAAEEETKKLEKLENGEEPEEEKKEDSKEEKSEESEETKEEESKEDSTEDSKEEDPENTSDGEEFEVDDETVSDEPVEEDPSVEENIEDEAEKTIEDAPYEKITTIDDGEDQGKIFDELEKEEDVQKAIELIRQRVADAEETFIKRNAEDKQKIDELLGRISDNVKTVEDMENRAETEENEAKAAIAKESAMIDRRRIANITENRPLSVFEKMTRVISTDVVKNEEIRESYMTESNTIDTAAVVESAKVMYGFLETLNTLQLESVDSKYLQKLIEEM